jgi:hypothetical protein
MNRFDALVIHYSIRLPFNQLRPETAALIAEFPGLKVLFIQDEYDHTHRAWYWIRKLGIQLVFTVVPEENVSLVYPPAELPGVRFVSNLTGYVPEEVPSTGTILPPSKRKLLVGYRGRPLAIRYGMLAQEKMDVGRLVKKHCEENSLYHDIAWTEDARIYGPTWYEFMTSCRSMLGSESGSNVFDWDGTLAEQIENYKKQHDNSSDDDIYRSLIAPLDQHGLMNQISPRVFEAISLRTILVLFEGHYSGILIPEVHFIPLKKDGSNLEEVFRLLKDGRFVDEMAERAYQDIIVSGQYNYQSFVGMVDNELTASLALLPKRRGIDYPSFRATTAEGAPTPLTTCPVRALPPLMSGYSAPYKTRVVDFAYRTWRCLPEGVRERSKPYLKSLMGRG